MNKKPTKIQIKGDTINTISNAAFLVPVVTAVLYQVYFAFILVLLLMIASFSFHIFKREYLRIIDKIFAHIVIIMNFYLWIVSGIINFLSLIGIVCVLISLLLFVHDKKSPKWQLHSSWHTLTALATTLFIIAYVTYA